MTLYIAILPTPQDRNGYRATPGIQFNTEAGAMQWFAVNKLVHRLRTLAAVDTAVIKPRWNESADENNGGHLSGLRRQMHEARLWLDVMPGPSERKIIISLHSDSGANWRHTLGITGRDGGREIASKRLALILATRAGEVFGHYPPDDMRVVDHVGTLGNNNYRDYNEYVFWQETAPYTHVLLELFSHENLQDLLIFYAAQDAVAQAIADGVAEWAGALPAELTALQERVKNNADLAWGAMDRIRELTGEADILREVDDIASRVVDIKHAVGLE